MQGKILDKSGALARVDGDEELYGEILGVFLEDTPVQITKLQEALAALDNTTAQRQAHSLKGSAANIGAMLMREVAYQMELSAKEGNLQKAGSLFGSLEEEFARVKDFITEHRLVR